MRRCLALSLSTIRSPASRTSCVILNSRRPSAIILNTRLALISMSLTLLQQTTATGQPFVAHTSMQPHGDTESDYDDMVYEYIDEKHITALHLLSTQQVEAAHQRAIEAPSSLSSESSQTERTEFHTIEEENDLPVSDH